MAKSVLVGLSGGIDSFYTAYIFKKMGYAVVGLWISMFAGQRDERTRYISDFLGIDLLTINAHTRFKEAVIEKSLNMVKNGLTPNPCAMCNRDIKFRILEDVRRELEITYIATGHYVNIERTSGYTAVYRGSDCKKEQSYFLSLVPKEYLENVIFPLGTFTKGYVEDAANAILSWNGIKSSQDLCFVGEGYKDLVRERLGKRPGYFLYNGKVVATHQGYYLYTIGESRGLQHKEPIKLYVERFEGDNIYLNVREACYKDTLVLKDVNLLGQLPPRCLVQVRYQAKAIPCHLMLRGHEAEVRLEEKAFAPTPGQIAAIYSPENNQLLGGGVISGTY